MAGERRLVEVTVRRGAQETRVHVPEGSAIATVLGDQDDPQVVFLNGRPVSADEVIPAGENGAAEVEAVGRSHKGGK